MCISLVVLGRVLIILSSLTLLSFSFSSMGYCILVVHGLNRLCAVLSRWGAAALTVSMLLLLLLFSWKTVQQNEIWLSREALFRCACVCACDGNVCFGKSDVRFFIFLEKTVDEGSSLGFFLLLNEIWMVLFSFHFFLLYFLSGLGFKHYLTTQKFTTTTPTSWRTKGKTRQLFATIKQPSGQCVGWVGVCGSLGVCVYFWNMSRLTEHVTTVAGICFCFVFFFL